MWQWSVLPAHDMDCSLMNLLIRMTCMHPFLLKESRMSVAILAQIFCLRFDKQRDQRLLFTLKQFSEHVTKIICQRHVTTSTHTLRFATWFVVSADVPVIT